MDDKLKKDLERLKKLGKKHKKIVASKEFKEGLKFFNPKVIAYTNFQLKLFKSKPVAILFNHISFFTYSKECEKKSEFYLKTYCTTTRKRIKSVKMKVQNFSIEYGLSRQPVYDAIKSLQKANVVLVEQEGSVYNLGINIDNYMGILLCTYIYFHWGQDVFPKNWKREFGLPKLV